MISKDYYKDTYDDIHVSAELLKKLENTEKRNRNNKRQWQFAIAVIAAICIIGGAVNHEKVVGLAKSLFGTFILSVKEEKMEFGDIQIVTMNQEKFIADKDTKQVDDIVYYHVFDSYEEMNQASDIVLPGADYITYKDISLDVAPEWSYGHISVRAIYGDSKFNISGMFAVQGFHQNSFGYGDNEGNIVEKYQYGQGKNAYFLRDNEGTDRVYFEECGILFQLSADGGKVQNAQVKELLDVFGK